MNSNVAVTNNGRLDILKWIITGLLLGAGVFGFYYFKDVLLILRVVGVLAIFAAAGAVAMQTDKGRSTIRFARESYIEVRKVVWPSRQETIQMTLVVLGMVAILSILVWIVDGILFYIVKQLVS